jgi:formylglycine-generating enzyme required for sulfatase activity
MNLRLAVKSIRLFVCILVTACCLPATESKPKEADKATTPASDSMPGKAAGQVRDDNGLKMKLVWCPPGKFTMGTPRWEAKISSLQDQVEVTLTKGFWLGKYEVTQSEWKQVMATEPWTTAAKRRTREEFFTKVGDDFPAAYINWEDAKEFCREFTEQERKASRVPDGWEYTLPTEAQWERACRAGTETKFSYGDDESKLADFAWFNDNASNAGEAYPHEVGKKKPNPWGLHDMHGNVWEWCRDWCSIKLPGGRDPEVAEEGSVRGVGVCRGGAWGYPARNCRSGCRDGAITSARYDSLGFRVALRQSGNK